MSFDKNKLTRLHKQINSEILIIHTDMRPDTRELVCLSCSCSATGLYSSVDRSISTTSSRLRLAVSLVQLSYACSIIFITFFIGASAVGAFTRIVECLLAPDSNLKKKELLLMMPIWNAWARAHLRTFVASRRKIVFVELNCWDLQNYCSEKTLCSWTCRLLYWSRYRLTMNQFYLKSASLD